MDRDCRVARSWAIFRAMIPYALTGITNKELCDKTKISSVNLCRDLATLEELKLVEKTTDGRWILTPEPVAMLKAYNLGVSGLNDRIDSFEQRSNAYARRV